MQINIINNNKDIVNFILDKNSCVGLPLYFYDNNTFYNFILIDDNSNLESRYYCINEIEKLDKDEKYSIKLTFGKIRLLMSLSTKIPRVKTLTINCEYMIINCLPCNIGIISKEYNCIIEKFSQQDIAFCDENESEISIQISANNTTFFSDSKRLFQKGIYQNKNYLVFNNSNYSQSFSLSLLIKNKYNKKIIVIYAESFFENKSDFDFYINSNLCFQISKKLYLISSGIDLKESSFKIMDDFYNYKSRPIKFEDIIYASPSYILNLCSKRDNNNINDNDYFKDKQIKLIIDNSLSNINIKNCIVNKYKIFSMIYSVYSFYRITNLLSNKNVIISNYNNQEEYIIIEPMKRINFDFFHRGTYTPLIFNINKMPNKNNNYEGFTLKIYLDKIGSYTFKIDENLINLEIRQYSSKGIIDVFIVETNFDNGKIVIDNSTNNIFSIYQNNYESFIQIIKGNEKQILNIYNQNLMIFNYQFGNGHIGQFKFIPLKVIQKKVDIGDNTIMYLESNGMKMKVCFYYKNIIEENKDLLEKYYFSSKFNEVLVSIIGDNEFKNKKLRNYERKEIVLLEMKSLFFEVIYENNFGLFNKDNISTKLSINYINLYNQINDNAEYIKVFNNDYSPFISLNNKLDHFKNENIWIIRDFDLCFSKIQINIEPQFIEKIIDFFDNITYRIKINNYKIDKLFINDDNNNQKQNIHLTQNYNKNSLIFYGENLKLSPLSIDFKLSKDGLENLLINKFGCSSFYIWAIKGLSIKDNNSINLESNIIPFYFGDIKSIGILIYQRYINSIKSKFWNIGFKGAMGNISDYGKKYVKLCFDLSLFGLVYNGLIKDKKKEDDTVIKIKNFFRNSINRKRIQRPFYGKFKYFKEFNQDDAYYLDLFQKNNNSFFNNLIVNNLIKDNDNLYVFTNSCLLIMNSKLEIYDNIHYFYIDEVITENNTIYIKYNQDIEGNSFTNFYVENDKLVKQISYILTEETAKNKDNINDI